MHYNMYEKNAGPPGRSEMEDADPEAPVSRNRM